MTATRNYLDIYYGIDDSNRDQQSEIIQSIGNRIDLAKQRQTAIWKREKADHSPILMNSALTAKQKSLPDPNFYQACTNMDSMLIQQLRRAMGIMNSNSDAVPSIRANFGAACILSCIRLEQDLFEDKMPWLQNHLSREEVAALTSDDIKLQGTFRRGLEQMAYYKEIFGNNIAIYCMDHQGPFDLAHLVMGDDIFLALYDDRALVHHCLELMVELSIFCIDKMKEISGEKKQNIKNK